ncbi:WD domain, G-beta repeat [Musa troglodytarum]|uniref:WD domain, G-beta repeat n=1 Tax=Musa troglodytarum TaxID=320322 RepID=A0A9E7JN83_9LILI|nr:WD domain, G-beta repeat [Musa troglodytarum]
MIQDVAADFQNVLDSVSRFGKVSCSSASIAWNPQRGEGQQCSFVLGFSSDLPQFNSSKSIFKAVFMVAFMIDLEVMQLRPQSFMIGL